MLVAIAIDYIHGLVTFIRQPFIYHQYNRKSMQQLDAIRARLIQLGYVYAPNPHGYGVVLVHPDLEEK